MWKKAHTRETCDKAPSTEEIPKYHLSCFIYYLRVQVENRERARVWERRVGGKETFQRYFSFPRSPFLKEVGESLQRIYRHLNHRINKKTYPHTRRPPSCHFLQGEEKRARAGWFKSNTCRAFFSPFSLNLRNHRRTEKPFIPRRRWKNSRIANYPRNVGIN